MELEDSVEGNHRGKAIGFETGTGSRYRDLIGESVGQPQIDVGAEVDSEEVAYAALLYRPQEPMLDVDFQISLVEVNGCRKVCKTSAGIQALLGLGLLLRSDKRRLNRCRPE